MSVKIKAMPLGPVSANCYIVTDCKTLLTAVIDPGDFNDELKNAVSKLNVKYIMLTHGHFDHILGVAPLKKATGAEILIHKLDAPCLEDDRQSLCAWELPKKQIPVSADRLLSDGDEIFLGETVFKVMHTPGHTKGSVCYISEEDRLIFSGDTLFCLTAGRTDLPGGSDEELMSSLKKLKSLNGDYRVLTGHNRETTLSFERTKNRYMRLL